MFRDLQKYTQSPKRVLKCVRDKKHMAAAMTLSGRLTAREHMCSPVDRQVFQKEAFPEMEVSDNTPRPHKSLRKKPDLSLTHMRLITWGSGLSPGSG